MVLNFSGVNLQLYFNTITAGHVSILTFVVLPPFLICILCILALVFAKEPILKIRVLLINILTAEALNWFIFFTMYLGWPVHFITNEDISWKIYICLFATIIVLKFASISIYGVSVYLFVRHGEKKLKWYVIIPVAADQGLGTTDQSPATTDQGPATIGTDLDTNPDSTGTH